MLWYLRLLSRPFEYMTFTIRFLFASVTVSSAGAGWATNAFLAFSDFIGYFCKALWVVWLTKVCYRPPYTDSCLSPWTEEAKLNFNWHLSYASREEILESFSLSLVFPCVGIFATYVFTALASMNGFKSVPLSSTYNKSKQCLIG